jgi:RNA polymerase sigma-70 factor (ECF subfamily)
MASDDSFAIMMSRLKGGDEAAASEVFRRYVRRLLALTSDQFDSWLRGKVDVEGVVQSAYKSFFAGYDQGRFDALSGWDGLWGLLVVITLRKCYRRHEYFRAECRDPGREVARAGGDDGRSPEDGWQAIDREPTPLEAAIRGETVEGLLDALDGPERAIVELSLQGHTTEEVAAELGRSQRTVRRVRERIKAHLKRLGDDTYPDRPPAGRGDG